MASKAPSSASPDPINLIAQVNRGRSPQLMQRKFDAMAHDRFAFLRGTAMLGHRALDLAALPAAPLGWVCGDLHLQNFGCFRGLNRLVYFDLNDFDEAARLPVSVDLLRFLGSICTAAPDMGLERSAAASMVQLALAAYASALARGKAFWLERETAIGAIKVLLKQAGERKRLSLLAARSHVVGSRRQIKLDGVRYLPVSGRAAVRAHIGHALELLASRFGDREFFRKRDIAFRIAGMGSLGVPRYVALVRGKGDPDRNALIDVKKAVASSAAQALPQYAQPAWPNEAARVVGVQDICQAASPAFLSAMTFGAVPFVVRELQPVEDRVTLPRLGRRIDRLDQTLQSMATLAAYAQLRSAGRMGAAGVDDLIEFGHELRARPRRWGEAARAVDAANSAAFANFRTVWQAGDERLHRLCEVPASADGPRGPSKSVARGSAARKSAGTKRRER
ncbi:conserved hypothetical protein [Burkholderiales bacterium]|nr:conserved hypothetical protein [Burkholderiales bacterium]